MGAGSYSPSTNTNPPTPLPAAAGADWCFQEVSSGDKYQEWQWSSIAPDLVTALLGMHIKETAHRAHIQCQAIYNSEKAENKQGMTTDAWM